MALHFPIGEFSPEQRELWERLEVYDGRAGIVHYSYSARVTPKGEAPREVTGKWTEIYLQQDDAWILIGVSGTPYAREVAAWSANAT